MIPLPVLGGLSALLGWGIGDYFLAKGKIGSYLPGAVVSLVGLLLWGGVLLARGFTHIELPVLFLAVLDGLLFSLGFVFFVRALSIGPVGIVSPIANSCPVITVALGVLFFGLTLSTSALAAMCCIILGVILLSKEASRLDWKSVQFSAIALAILSMFIWGVAFALIDPLFEKAPFYEVLFLISASQLFSSMLLKHFFDRATPFSLMFSTQSQTAWAAGALLVGGNVLFFFAGEISGSIAIPVTIASAAPLVTALIARIRDGEKLSLAKRIGALFVVFGIMALSAVV
jgi:drug/metabolite transporter (DMT)-like permease